MFLGNKIEETCKSLDLHSEEKTCLFLGRGEIPRGLVTDLPTLMDLQLSISLIISLVPGREQEKIRL